MTLDASQPALVDRGDWRRVRFGDVVDHLTAKASDPAGEGIGRYVGLEHMDAGRLRIGRWGNVEEGTSFNRRFLPGQVLFGKRRVYQRKAAVADFAGICSGDILVFAAREAEMSPTFLPFVVSSDDFVAHATRTSAGSLSPRTRWRDLANFEFLLPPIDRQAELAELLWSVAECVERWAAVAAVSETAYRAALRRLLGGPPELCGSPRPVGEVGEVQGGRQLSPKHRTGRSPLPYLRVANVFDGYFDLSEVKEMDFTQAERSKFELRVGDILLNEGQSRELVGRSAICDDSVVGLGYQNTLIRFRPGEEILPGYAQACFRHAQYTGGFAAIASQTTSIAHLGVERFARYPIPVPSLERQRQVVGTLDAIAAGHAAAAARSTSTRDLFGRVARELLVGGE